MAMPLLGRALLASVLWVAAEAAFRATGSLTEEHQKGYLVQNHGHDTISRHDHIDSRSAAQSEDEAEKEEDAAESSLATEVPKVIAESNKVNSLMTDVDDLLQKKDAKSLGLMATKVSAVKKTLNHMYHHFRGAVQKAELNKEMHADYDVDLFDASQNAVKTLGGALDKLSAQTKASADDEVEILDDLNTYLQTFCTQMNIHFQTLHAKQQQHRHMNMA